MPPPRPANWPFDRLCIAAVISTKNQKNGNAGVASPAAAGPAGSYFEGQIGAQLGAEPRGLPGTRTITFAPGDPVFRDVAEQVARDGATH
jgi:hypothetical protein